MTLVTNGGDGWPHATAMWFAPHDGGLAFMAYCRSQKCRNIARDDRVTCMVEAGTGYAELRGVQMRGHARPVLDDDRVVTACAIAQRYSGQPVNADEVAERTGSRIVYTVSVVGAAGWDHRKLSR